VSARINPKVVWQTWKILPRYYRTFIRSAFIGFWMASARWATPRRS